MGTPYEDVTFSDPGLQECYEALQGTIYWRPYAEEIEVLRCYEYGIRSLDGIEALSGLLQFQVWENPEMQNIDALANNQLIDTLFLNKCNIKNSDLSTITQLSALIRLELLGNELGDVSSLATLSNLEDLGLDGSDVTSGLLELQALTKMQVLTISANPDLSCAELEEIRRLLSSTTIIPRPEQTDIGVDCTLP